MPTLHSAAVLLYQRRFDAARRRGQLRCLPPNVPCGDRCIPPSWKCRRGGQGIDSHAKAARFDPVKGLASVIKGSRDLAKGALTLNVERVNTGKNSLSRGLTKLNPDSDLKRKQELRRQIDDWLIPITSVGLLAMGIAGGHNALKYTNIGGYRTGLGAQLDTAALGAVNGFWNAVPGVAQSRSRQAALTAGSFSSLGRAGRLSQLRERQSNLTPRASNTLGGSRRVTALGNRKFTEIDTLARKEGMSFEAWQAQRSKAQIGLTRAGKSVYADDAATDYLAASFGIRNSTGRVGLSKDEVISSVTQRLSASRSALSTAMKDRGMNISNRGDQDKLWSEFSPEIEKQFRSLNARQKATAMSQSKTLYRKLMTSSDPETVAKQMFKESSDFFDVYFKDAAERVGRPPAAADSFAKPAMVAVARAISGGKAIINPSHASWINRAHYDKTVSGSTKSIFVTDRTLLSTASQLSGAPMTDPDEALRVLQLGTYGGRSFAPVPSLARSAQRPRQRPTTPKPRKDASDSKTKGQPCGKGYIARNFKCLQNQSQGGGEKSKKTPESGSLVKTAGKVALAAGLTAGAVMAAKKGSGLALRARGPLGDKARSLHNDVTALTAKYGVGLSNRGVERLSSRQVKEAIDKLPKEWRGHARKMVGAAKYWTAEMGLRARGAELVSIDNVHNYSTWKYGDQFVSLSSIGDDVLTFNTTRGKNIGKFANYEMNFQINNKFDAASQNASANAIGIYKANTSIFKTHTEQLPENAFISVRAYGGDGKGAKRASVYKKWGFKAIPNMRGNNLWALKNQGKFTKIPDDQMDMVREMIVGRKDSLPEPEPAKGAPVYGSA
jgi:hypothetical protein